MPIFSFILICYIMSASLVLSSTQQILYRFGGPLLLAIGSISCLLNLLIFTKGTLRKNHCTINFIAINIIHVIYLYMGLFFTSLSSGYGIDPSAKSIVFCRLRFYVGFVISCCQSSLLVVATIDRTLITSSNNRIRRLTTRRVMIAIILVTCLFWTIVHTHALFFTEIRQIGPNSFVCTCQQGTYIIFITYYIVIINGVLPPILMTIFSCWTVRNIHRVRCIQRLSRVSNTRLITTGRPYSLQSKDHQLIRMLFVEILVYLICKSPITLLFIYLQITNHDDKTTEQGLVELLALQIIFFVYYIENSIGFYMNIIVSKTFRTEFKRIVLRICHH